MFRAEEEAETFRRETDKYPDGEDFSVTMGDHEDLEVLVQVWEYRKIALRGPEPDTISLFDADDFIGILIGESEGLGSTAATDPGRSMF